MKDVIEIFYDYMIIQREINDKREKETVSWTRRGIIGM